MRVTLLVSRVPCLLLSLFNKQRSPNCSMFCCETFKKWGETLDHVSCSSLHFFRALTASCVLFNNTEHSQGFSICFITKNPLNSLRITFNFQNKLYFQSKSQSINVVTSGTKQLCISFNLSSQLIMRHKKIIFAVHERRLKLSYFRGQLCCLFIWKCWSLFCAKTPAKPLFVLAFFHIAGSKRANRA